MRGGLKRDKAVKIAMLTGFKSFVGFVARSATDFADFFQSKVNKIREATDGAPPPTFTDVDVMQPPCTPAVQTDRI